MILLGNILIAVAGILGTILSILSFLIIVRCILSWVNADPNNSLVRIVIQATDPIFNFLGRWRLRVGALDLTPILAILIIYFVQNVVVQTLEDYGYRLRMSNLEVLRVNE